jgi:hypothetical protein
MRRLVTLISVVLVLPAVGAQAAPRCHNVATDPTKDTYAFPTGSSLYDEPAMDITAVNFRSDAKTLTVVTTVVDVDAPSTTAPLGRGTWVIFNLGEASFLAAVAEGVDAKRAHLAVGELDQGVEQGGGGASAWTGTEVADLRFRVDRARNQIRVEVPLAVLRKHAGAPVGRGSYLSIRDAFTFDLEGISGAHTGSSVDMVYTNAGWSLGSPSCA